MDEFKREAVVLLRDGGRPLTQVAAELGLEPSVLRRWRSLANGAGQAASMVRPGAVAVSATVEQLEIRHLRRELERTQMERDTAWCANQAPWCSRPNLVRGQAVRT